jgi:hypothetical protein
MLTPQAIKCVQDIVRRYVPEGVSLADELIRGTMGGSST